MSRKSFAARAAALVGAAAIGALAIFGAAVPASAAGANIDASQVRTLTIHKHERTATNGTTAGTGQQITGASNIAALGAPIAGVTFQVQQVNNIDLTTPAGWTTVQNLTPSQAAARGLGTAQTVATDSNGLAVFNNLPIGAYLVQETAAGTKVADRTAPFLVTVPTATGKAGTPSNTWVYDVHVYPKNSTTDLTKTRVNAAAGSAEALNANLQRWNVAARIPQIASGETFENFTVVDTIDTAYLQFLLTDQPSGVAAGGTVTATNATGTAFTLTSGTDYTVVKSTDGKTLTLSFTSAGYTKLAANKGGTVTLNVLTKATAVPANTTPAGTIVNNASSTIKISNSPATTNTTSATGTVASFQYFAYAPVKDAAGNTTKSPLANATFELYPSAADAAKNENKIVIDGKSSWTTDANGQYTFPVLNSGTYVVKETAAPAGFELPTLNIPTTGAGANTTYYAELPHDQQLPTWALPFTGGNGPVLFAVGGGALLVIALGAALVVARRRQAAAAHANA
jgi:hypothetical protein